MPCSFSIEAEVSSRDAVDFEALEPVRLEGVDQVVVVLVYLHVRGSIELPRQGNDLGRNLPAHGKLNVLRMGRFHAWPSWPLS